MYNVELYNRTTRRVIDNKPAATEAAAAAIARDYIERAKNTGDVLSVSAYQTSRRGYIFGQTITTAAGIFKISTARR